MKNLVQAHRSTKDRYNLFFTECEKGHRKFGTRTFCPKCGRSVKVKPIPLCLSVGKLVTFSHFVDYGNRIVPAIAEREGGRIGTRISDAEPSELKIGIDLEPTFRRFGETDEGVIIYGTGHRPLLKYYHKIRDTFVGKGQKVGIIGWGAHIPISRIKMEEIEVGHGVEKGNLAGVGFLEKAVPSFDQDTITMSVDAARNALMRAGVKHSRIEEIFVGSESHPYIVKPSASTVAEALGVTPNVKVNDTEFACKAATGVIYNALNSVGYTLQESGLPQEELDAKFTSLMEKGKMLDISLVIGADNSQAEEFDALDATVGTGAGALLFGRDNPVALLRGYSFYTTDTPDFWRREGEMTPSHGGRFTGKPAYFKHVIGAAKKVFEQTGIKPEQIDYAVLHQPTGVFPQRAAKELGIDPAKVEAGFIAKWIGNSYSASTMVGMCNVLDQAKPGQLILHVGYGSGAGADAFIWETTEHILEKQKFGIPVKDLLERKKYVGYSTYRKMKSGH